MEDRLFHETAAGPGSEWRLPLPLKLSDSGCPSDINWQPHAPCYTLLPGPTWHFPYLAAFTYYNSTCDYPHPVSCINLWGLSSGVEDMHFVLQLPTTYFICTTLFIDQVEWPASFAGLPRPLLTKFQSRGLAIAVHIMTTCMLRAETHLHTDSG